MVGVPDVMRWAEVRQLALAFAGCVHDENAIAPQHRGHALTVSRASTPCEHAKRPRQMTGPLRSRPMVMVAGEVIPRPRPAPNRSSVQPLFAPTLRTAPDLPLPSR